MQETDRATDHQSQLRGRVRDAMSVRSPRLDKGATIAEAAHLLWRTGWVPAPLLDGGGGVVGVVSAHDVVRAVATRTDVAGTPATTIAQTEVPMIRPDDPLMDAAAKLERTGQPVILVMDGSRLVGSLTVTDVEGYRLIESVLGTLAAEVVTDVSPNDLMYNGSWGAYAYAGVTAVQCIRDVLTKLDRPDPASILDLPCGHGRELRFLKVVYPNAHFGVCDVDADGVDFCARVFGGEPTVSHVDPAQVSFPRRYELAWSGSLFTHLSADRWQGFLELFARSIEPGGLVLFTANGYLPETLLRDLGLSAEEAERILADFKRDRFGYVDAGDGSWGLSLARPAWMKEQIERSPLELVSFEQGAWKPPYPPQHVLVCTAPAA